MPRGDIAGTISAHVTPKCRWRSSIGGLDAYRGFEPPARAAIERDNALALFPRLKARS